MKKNDVITSIAFFAICLIPMIFLNTEKNVVSKFDNRKLTELTSMEDGENLSKHLEKYLNDRIGFRDSILTVHQLWNSLAFGKLSHPLYDFGKDGYVFFEFNDYQWEKVEYMTLFSDMLGRIQKYCYKNGTDFRVMINPSKEVVYSEYLPDGVHHRSENIDFFLSKLDLYGVRYTYTADVLIEEKKEMSVFNKKYDAGHWNDAGAFTGCRKLLIDLESDGYTLEIPEKEDFYQEKTLKKYLMNSCFPINEEIESWKPYAPQTVPNDTYNEEIEKIISPNYPEYECRKNLVNTDAPRLLIFRGSYLENRMKFLSDSFSESLAVIGYDNIGKFEQLYQMFAPDIVVFETADYAMNESLFPDSVLRNTL